MPAESTAGGAALEIVSAGLGVSVQDLGRPGHRSIGVPLSGALDPLLLAAANHLAGSPADAAGLEVLLAGPLLRAAGGPVCVALAGELAGRIVGVGGDVRMLTAWSAAVLQPGDSLQLGRPQGVGYVAVGGGLLTPPMLGSRATYARAGLGGVGGRALTTGDRLPCLPFVGDPQHALQAAPLQHPGGPIRVIPGPQMDHFTPAALASFYGEPWALTPARDRMGLRLAGPRLAHVPGGADIVSDGVTPGAIQVPADGQPIVLLADCQTVGGYPKIATVIRADLPRLAHLPPGAEIRFEAIDIAQATAARTAQARRFAAWCASVRPRGHAGEIPTETLLAANLAGAALRGDEEG